MKIASISCIARHPKGLNLHIRNLRWALQKLNYQIYIFTQKCWNLEKSKYPDVIFIETDGEPLEFKHFWSENIPDYIVENCHEDLFLFIEQDQWFKHPIMDLANLAYKDQTIVLSKEEYSASITIDGFIVYPRIWEGGVIFPRSYLIDAYVKYGVNYDDTFLSDFVCDKLKLCKRESIGNKLLNTFKKGDKWDTMIEMCCYCYFQKIPVKQFEMTVHFSPTEQIHKRHPNLYKKDIKSIDIKKAKEKEKIHYALFMFYISSVIELNYSVKDVFKLNSSDLLNKISQLGKVDQWMSYDQLKRLNKLKNYLDLDVKI